MDKTGKILIKAAELVAERGLAKGLRISNGSLCAYGAIAMAVNGAAYCDSGCAKAQDRMSNMLRLYDFSVWNNEPERTKEEVIDALVAAAYWEG